jgi:hypothetical protein
MSSTPADEPAAVGARHPSHEALVAEVAALRHEARFRDGDAAETPLKKQSKPLGR